MTRRNRLLLTIFVVLASSASISVVHASCRLEEITEFHVDLVGNSPVIDGQVNGQPIRILLETGSDVSYLTRTAAAQLNLPLRSEHARGMFGANGVDSLVTTNIKEFKVGTLVLKNYTANVGAKVISDAKGVTSFQLGVDFLSQFTTEWDLAHGVVRFFRPKECKLEQLAYWASSYYQISLEAVSNVHPSLDFDIKINGKAIKAQLLSGSAISFIRQAGAREVGVDPGGSNAPSAADITGLAPNPIKTWIGRFETFEVGGERIQNARLLIGELTAPNTWEYSGDPIPQRVRSPSVYLGADFLQAHRILVAPDKRVAFFTYNGGAVFQAGHTDQGR
jgi:predicted aspartyl protease